MPLLDPYAGSWTTEEAAHLARRAGFGASQTEIASLVSSGVSGAVSSFVDYDPASPAVQLAIDGLPDTGDFTSLKNPQDKRSLQGWWCYHFANSAQPLQEQLLLFLHDTITTEWGKVSTDISDRVNPGNDGTDEDAFCLPSELIGIDEPLAPDETRGTRWTARLIRDQNALMRRHGAESWGELLKLITRDPAMLVYLDNKDNRNTGVQENFSREIMELFSMGVGNYSEQDVVALARVFTGETIEDRCERNFPLTYFWDPAIHSSGDKTVLGEVIPFSSVPGEETDMAIDLIMSKVTNSGLTPAHATQTAASLFIAWRLLAWFLYENIEFDDPAVAELAAVFDGISVNGYRYDVKETLRTLFASELFYDSAYRWAMVKHPVDYMMMPSRTIGLQDGGYVSRMPRYLEAMGMDILNPPDVNGWDHGRSWLYSGAMIARFNYANELSRSAIATDSWCDSLIPGAIASTSDNAGILAFFRDVLVQRTFRAQQETELMAFMAGIDDGAGSAQQKFRRKVRGALHLAMATPEYQLK